VALMSWGGPYWINDSMSCRIRKTSRRDGRLYIDGVVGVLGGWERGGVTSMVIPGVYWVGGCVVKTSE